MSKFAWRILLIEFYLFIPLSVILITFQGHSIVSDHDQISRSQQCQIALAENFLCLSDWVETLQDCEKRQANFDYSIFFFFLLFLASLVFKGDN